MEVIAVLAPRRRRIEIVVAVVAVAALVVGYGLSCCCNGIIVLVSGHGIQYPVRASQRALHYENHPFHSQFASSKTTTSSTTQRRASTSYQRQQQQQQQQGEQSWIQLTSQLVPPIFETTIDYNNTTNYSIPTIGSFSTKSSNNNKNNNQYKNNTSEVLGYRVNYQPVRISAFLSENYKIFFASEEQWNILQYSIIQPALTAWSDALHTIPVVGNLTLDPSQLYHYETDTSTSSSNYYYYCGSNPLSNQPIPQPHLSYGVPHTDTLLYITLGFASDWSSYPHSTSTNTSTNTTSTSPPPPPTSSSEAQQQHKDQSFAIVVKNETELYHLPTQKTTTSTNKNNYNDNLLVHHNYTTGTQQTWPMDNNNNLTNIDILRTQDSSSNTSAITTNVTLASTTTTVSSSSPPPKCAFASNILASAEFCNTDQFDRPTVGVLHLCITQDWFLSSATVEYAAKTVVHEIGHVLGFNSISMAYLRHPLDGSPRTPRDSNGNVPFLPCNFQNNNNNNNVDASTNSSSSSTSTTNDTTTATMIPFPSEDTLRFTTRRNGIRVAEVVTETVAMIARNQFNCPNLLGAELDSPMIAAAHSGEDFTAENFCFGSHWSRRLFQSDIMNPIVDQPVSTTTTTTVNNNNSSTSNQTLSHYMWMFSPLTMAYFIDTGWYRINPARVSNVQHGWGRGAGCDFIDQPCVDPSTGSIPTLNQPFYCNQPNIDYTIVHGCTEDFSHKAVCELVDYGPDSSTNTNNVSNSNSGSTDDSTIPPQFRYFDNAMGESFTKTFLAAMQLKSSNTPQGYETTSDSEDDVYISTKSKTHMWGGLEPDAEYCPYYRGFSNGLCSSPDTEKVLRTNEVEDFGNNSRCVTAYASSRMTGLCMPIACVVSDKSLRIQVDGVWTKCHYAGEIIRLSWWIDASYIVCPDPIRTCPTFWCPQNCLGSANGVCDYLTGQCMCPVTVGNVTTTNPYKQSSGPNNITMLPCDADPYDTWNVSSHRRGDRPDGAQFVRMELALSQYYVSDSAVLSNKKTTFIRSLRRFFSQLPPLESAIIAFALIAAIIATLFGLCSCCCRFQKFQQWREFLCARRSRQNAADDNENNRTPVCEKNEKVVVSASMLLWLRLCTAFRSGSNNRQDPRRVTPLGDQLHTSNSTTEIAVVDNSGGNRLDLTYFNGGRHSNDQRLGQRYIESNANNNEDDDIIVDEKETGDMAVKPKF